MMCVNQQYGTSTHDRREHMSKRAFVERDMASILPERKSAEVYHCQKCNCQARAGTRATIVVFPAKIRQDSRY